VNAFARLRAHLRAQWAGLLALALVLAGGTAYAANTVFTQDIVNGQVRPVDLYAPLAADGATEGPLTLQATDPFVPVIETNVRTRQPGGVCVGSATLEVDNQTGSRADVTFRFRHDGALVGSEITNVLPPDAIQTVTIVYPPDACDPPGLHRFTVEADSAFDLELQTRTLWMAALPRA
jgi:hypothetical protein